MNETIESILVIGAGGIGTQVAALCALRGFRTHVHDISQSQLDNSRQRILALYRTLEKQGFITSGQADAAKARLTFFDDLTAATVNADLVIESVPENLEEKHRVFRQLDNLCPPDTIVTTNSSDIPPSLMASVLRRPERLAAFHFHAPLNGADVVDIMPHPGTAPAVIKLLLKVADQLGQTAIELKVERPGYVFNNMLNALLRSALELAVDEVALPETIDKVWTEVMHAPMGPFRILDRVGLDTARDIAKLGAEFTQDAALLNIVDYLDGYIERGWLGIKSGRGFYSYAPLK